MTVPVQSVSIDRTELELDPLLITNSPFGTSFSLDEGGLADPEFQTRVAFAPDSVYIPGQRALAAVQGPGGLPLVITARAATSAALETLKAELQAALNQWMPAVTVSIDGVSKTYVAVYPVTPSWGVVDSGMVRAFMARTSVTVVVNPPSGA